MKFIHIFICTGCGLAATLDYSPANTYPTSTLPCLRCGKYLAEQEPPVKEEQ